MGKTPCCEKDGLKKGPWTPEEDQKLIDYVQKHGHGRWRTLPKNAGLKRCGKSCRLRWTNYLRPDIKRGRFSFEEEETIIQLHSVLGNKWSSIAARLPGRTDNEIKNYWNTHIRKRLLKMGIDPVTHTPRLDLLELSSLLSSTLYNNSSLSSQLNINPTNNYLGMGVPLVNQNFLNLASALLSNEPKLLSTTSTTTTTTSPRFNNIQENQVSITNPDQNYQLIQSSFQPNQPIQNQLIQPSEFRTCTTSSCSTSTTNSNSTVPFLNESQFMQSKLMEQYYLSQSLTSFNGTNCPNSLTNIWQDNSINQDQALITPADSFVTPMASNGYQDSTIQSDQAFVSGSSNLQSINYQNMSFSSLLSTPSSSPNTLNSSLTTYNNVNSSSTISHEDERDGFCSNNLMYDIVNALNGNELV